MGVDGAIECLDDDHALGVNQRAEAYNAQAGVSLALALFALGDDVVPKLLRTRRQRGFDVKLNIYEDFPLYIAAALVATP